MKIKCIKDVVMNTLKKETAYISGKIYVAIYDGRYIRAKDEQGNKNHCLSKGDEWFNEHFEIVSTIPAKLINTDNPQFLPTRKYPKDAGADLRARIPQTIVVQPGQTVKIPSGIGVEIPEGYVGLIQPRSGASSEGKLVITGTIDSNYRGEMSMNVLNPLDSYVVINPQERLAQLVILPYLVAEFEQVDELGESDRGAKGFGSSGRF